MERCKAERVTYNLTNVLQCCFEEGHADKHGYVTGKNANGTEHFSFFSDGQADLMRRVRAGEVIFPIGSYQHRTSDDK